MCQASKKGLEFFEKHGFKNLIAKFNKKNTKKNINKKQKKNEKKYQIIESVDHLKKIIKGIQRQKLVVIDTETNSLNETCLFQPSSFSAFVAPGLVPLMYWL